jgi:hypothetical protein
MDDTAGLFLTLTTVLIAGGLTAAALVWIAVRRKHIRHRNTSRARRRDHTKVDLVGSGEPASRGGSRSTGKRRHHTPKIDLISHRKPTCTEGEPPKEPS